MKVSDNIGRPWLIMTESIAHQLCFLISFFRLTTQSLSIVIFKLIPLVIAQLHYSKNDVGRINRVQNRMNPDQKLMRFIVRNGCASLTHRELFDRINNSHPNFINNIDNINVEN